MKRNLEVAFRRVVPLQIAIQLLIACALCCAPANGTSPRGEVPFELLNQSHPFRYRQTADFENFRQGLSYNPGATRIEWSRNERESPNHPWFRLEGRYSFSFKLTALAARQGGDVVFLAGVQHDGTDVIEKWTFPVRTGGWYHTSAGAPPFGTPAGAYAGATQIKGGNWIAPLVSAPPSEPNQPTTQNPKGTHTSPLRQVIYKGATLGHVRWMEADPEDRYLLLQSHEQNSIYRIELGGFPVPAPAVAPEIGPIAGWDSVIFSVSAVLVQGGARVIILREPPQDFKKTHTRRIILIDQDNDGVFDSSESMLYTDFRVQYDLESGFSFPWQR